MESRHPQVFTKLNLPPLPIEEFLVMRLNRIGVTAQTIPVLEEIREVIFRIPYHEVEKQTKALCQRMIQVLAQIGLAQGPPELVRLRNEILELLWVLNFHFAQDNTQLAESISTLFKFITDGTLDDMSAAIRIVRQTFEHVEPISATVLMTIGSYTLKAGEHRLAWLTRNEDRIKADWYFPFLTLLTVLSFCGKSFDQIHDPICDVLANTRQFLLNHKEDTKTKFGKYLPTVAIKARMVHSAMISVDNSKRDMKMEFLPEAYINLSKVTPLAYQSIHDELASSLIYYLGQKIDDKRVARVRGMLPYFLDYYPQTAESVTTVITIVSKICETTVLPFKVSRETIEPIIYFAGKSLDMYVLPTYMRLGRVHKLWAEILRKSTFETEQDLCTLADFILLARHALDLIAEEAEAQKIDPTVHTTDMEIAHDLIQSVAYIFDGFSKFVDFFNKCVKAAYDYQQRLDRLHWSQTRKVDPTQPPQRLAVLGLPFDSYICSLVVDTYIATLCTLMKLRKLWHKCSLKFSHDPATSNYETSMKACRNNLAFTRMSERVRGLNMLCHRVTLDSLANCPSTAVLSSVWYAFLRKVLDMTDMSNLDPSVLRTLFGNMMLLTTFFEASINMIIDNIENNKHISDIIFFLTLLLEKIFDGMPAQTQERKEPYLKILLDAFENLRNLIIRGYRRLPDIHKLFLLMTETAKYIEGYLGKAGFCKTMFSKEFVVRITCFFRTMPDEDSVLLRFLFVCNKYAPETLENEEIISFLVSSVDKEPLKSLTLLDAIRQRKRHLVSGDVIGRKITPAALECMKLPGSQRTEAPRRVAKSFLAGYEPSFADLSEKEILVLVKNGHKLEINAHSLLMALSQTALENDNCQAAWDLLHDIIMTLLDPKEGSSIRTKPGFVDTCKVVGSVCVSLALRAECRREKIAKFFSKLAVSVRADVHFLAVLICYVIRYKYMLPADVFDLSVLNSAEAFDDFLDECIRLTESVGPNVAVSRIPLCSLILSQCQPSVMNMLKFSQFVIRALQAVPLYEESLDFVFLDKIKFEELVLLPKHVKEIIISTKEHIKEAKEDYSPLLDNLHCVTARIVRVVTVEFLSVSGIKADKVSKFVGNLLGKQYTSTEEKLYVLDVLGLAFRLCQSALNKYRAEAESILSSLDLDRVPLTGRYIIISALEPLLSGVKTDPEFVTDKLVQIVLASVTGTPIVSRVILLLFSSANKERQKDIWRYLVTKVKEDGLVDFGNKNQHTCIGNWTKVVRYWRSLCVLSPAVLVSTIVSQLAAMSVDGIEITSVEMMRANLDVLCRLLTVPHIQKHINTVEKLFEKTIDALLGILKRCNMTVPQVSKRRMITFMTDNMKASIEYLRSRYMEVEWTPVIYTLLTNENGQDLYEAFMEDQRFIVTALKFEDKPTKIQFQTTLLVIKSDDLMDTYFDHVLSVVSYLFASKSQQLYALPILELIAEHYSKICKRAMEIIIAMMEQFDHRNYGYCRNLLAQIIKDPEVTMEQICDLALAHPAKMEQFCDFLVKPYVIAHKESFPVMAEKLGTNVHNKLFIMELGLEKIPDFTVKAADVIPLLRQVDNDQDKDRIFLLWSKCSEDTGFTEMFERFMESLSVHISVHQSAVCERLKIPKTANIERVAMLLEQYLYRYMRHPATLVGVWKILVNNADLFPSPLARFWKVIINQMSGVRFYAKKTQLMPIIRLCEFIADLFCKYPLVPNVSHYVVYYYGSFLVETLKTFPDNAGLQARKCVRFVECCYQTALKFGPQLRIVQEFCALFVDCCSKLLPYSHQEASQVARPPVGPGNPPPQQSPANQAIAQFVHEVLFPYAGKMISVALKFDTPYISEQLVDVLYGCVNINCQSWPYALYSLSLIANAGIHMDKIRRLLELLDRDIIGPAIFPMFWANDNFSDLRSSKLLPYAIKYCSKEQIEHPLVVYLTNSVLKTIIDVPHGQTLQRLLNEIQASGKKLNSALISSLLSNPPRARFVTGFVENLLQNPDVCIMIPSVVRENAGQYPWTNLAKMAFCLQRNSETCLEELSTVDIRSLASLAKSTWGSSIPLTMILHYFLPGNLTRRQIFGGVKVLRTDFCIKTIDNFFLYSASPFLEEDTELREHRRFTPEALSRWSQIEDYFSLLSEIQVSDICDGRKSLEGFSLSGINMFLHHGMTHQALFSFKESLNNLSSEDLAKIQIHEDVFPNYTTSSLGEFVSNVNDAIEQAVRELPPVARCPYSDKLAAYLMARKYRKIGRVMAGEKKLRFSKALSHFFSPQAHKAFASLRAAAYKIVPPNMVVPEPPIHEKELHRSLHQHFGEQRPPLQSASELVAEENSNWKQLLFCFVSHIKEPEWRHIFEKVVVSGLRSTPDKDFFIAALYSLLSQSRFDFGDCLKSLPAPWIPAFRTLGVDQLIPEPYTTAFYTKSPDLRRILDNLTEIDMDSAEEGEFYRTTIEFSNICEPCLVPLRSDGSRVSLIDPVVTYDRDRIAFNIRATNGEYIPFVITKEPLQSPDLSCFFHCVSGLMSNFVDSAKRSQNLISTASVEFKPGFWLTQTSAVPIRTLADGRFCKLTPAWNVTLAYKYAAICAVQYLLKAPPIPDSAIWVDESHCQILVRRMSPGSGDVKFNLIPRYLDELLITGPFRAGLLSAFICFAYCKEKLAVYLESILGVDSRSAIAPVEALSIADSPDAEVVEAIDALIQLSVT